MPAVVVRGDVHVAVPGDRRVEDILSCPNFVGVIAARLAGSPLEEAHRH
jgi:hypothetical protein